MWWLWALACIGHIFFAFPNRSHDHHPFCELGVISAYVIGDGTCGDPVLSNRVFYVCTVIVGALNVGIAFYEVGF